jgi:hypothetical protein
MVPRHRRRVVGHRHLRVVGAAAGAATWTRGLTAHSSLRLSRRTKRSHFEVAEAALTGESVPVSMTTAPVAATALLADRRMTLPSSRCRSPVRASGAHDREVSANVRDGPEGREVGHYR